MRQVKTYWHNPSDHIRHSSPTGPMIYLSPKQLQATARRFLAGFPGRVTYAVKANQSTEVLANLSAAGITGFDVASPVEMDAVRAVQPEAELHYNNPVRSPREIVAAKAHGVVSYSVDSHSELAKLDGLGPVEVAVRLRLPVTGAAYDFGSKFGLLPEPATALLRAVRARGFRPAITFHPGTQCTDPAAWEAYISAAAQVAHGAGVEIARLNVGGGFPAHRGGAAPDLERIFDTIDRAATDSFGSARPQLLCEPGRAMVAEAFALATQIRALRDDGAVFLDDGIYGGLSEFAVLGAVDRVRVLNAEGQPRTGPRHPRVLFGPTCDSLDRIPGEIPLAADLAEGDWLLFEGMGAYSLATVTRFNGYGALSRATVVSTAP